MKFFDASKLEIGELAIIEKMEPNENRGKLFELGFVEGTTIKKMHASFDQQNICYAINNTMFALRQKEAQSIIVSRKNS